MDGADQQNGAADQQWTGDADTVDDRATEDGAGQHGALDRGDEDSAALSARSGMVRVSEVDQPTGTTPAAKPQPAIGISAADCDEPANSNAVTRTPPATP